jgi:hypothetical protein
MTTAVLLVLALWILPEPAAARDWMAAYDRGEIVVYTRPVKISDQPEAIVKAVINAPPQKVWAIVSRCADYTRTMNRIVKSAELSRSGSPANQRLVCRVTVDVPFPYSDLTATTRVVHRVGNGRWYRTWRLWHGDYKFNRGSWTLTYFKGNKNRTMVVYRALAVPKAWVPGWIKTMATKRSLPEMIRRLRAQVGG